MRHRVFRIGARVLMTISVFALVAGSVLGVSRASAILQEVAETGLPGFLSLRADPLSPHWRNLTPGAEVHWLIEASLADADSSTLSLELRSEGPLVDAGAMQVSVTTCDVEFSRIDSVAAPICGGQANAVISDVRLSSIAQADHGEIFPLADLHTDSPRHLLVSLGVAPQAQMNNPAGMSMRVGVGLHASGESDPPGTPLTATGIDGMVFALLGGGIFTALTGTLLLNRARRQS